MIAWSINRFNTRPQSITHPAMTDAHVEACFDAKCTHPRCARACLLHYYIECRHRIARAPNSWATPHNFARYLRACALLGVRCDAELAHTNRTAWANAPQPP